MSPVTSSSNQPPTPETPLCSGAAGGYLFAMFFMPCAIIHVITMIITSGRKSISIDGLSIDGSIEST